MSVFGENSLQRFYDYLQRHGLIGGDAVFLVYRRTPGVVAANAHLLGGNAHPCVPDTGQLIQMQGVFQLVGAVGEDAHFKRLVCLGECQTVLCAVKDRECSHTGAVAAFLRVEVAGEVFLRRGFPQPEACAAVSVAVVFRRPHAIIPERAELPFQLEVQRKHWHMGHAGNARIGDADAQSAVKMGGIGHGVTERWCARCPIGKADLQGVRLFLPADILALGEFSGGVPLRQLFRCAGTSVVVRHGSPEADLRGAGEVLEAVVFQRADAALFFVEQHREVLAVHTEDDIPVDNDGLGRHYVRCRGRMRFHNLLCKRHLVSGGSPVGVGCRDRRDVADRFAGLGRSRKVQRNGAALAGGHIPRESAGVENGAVLLQPHQECEVAGVRKEIPVLHRENAVPNGHPEIGVERFQLLYLGGGCAVGVDHAVGAEAVVCGSVPEISAIGEDGFAVVVLRFQCLIDIVPDEAALVCRILVFQVGVEMHAAQRISHGVHVFAAEIRSARLLFQVVLDLLWLCVHAALHVCDVVVFVAGHLRHALIVHQTGGVAGTEIGGHGGNILAAVGLVATGPDEDTGVVFVPLIHGPCPIQHGGFPLRTGGRHVSGGVECPCAVGFQIGFVDEIDAVAVAELVPEGVVGIVAGADGVDVVLFHEADVEPHVLFGDGSATLGVEFVAVDAFEEDALAVQAHDAVFQFEAAESHHGSADLQLSAGCVGEQNGKGIEVGTLGAPGTDVFHGVVDVPHTAGLCDHSAGCIGEQCPDAAVAFDVQRGGEDAVFAVIVGGELHVTDVGGGGSVEKDIPKNAGEPPEILIFQPAGAASLENGDGELVAGVPQKRGQLKF